MIIAFAYLSMFFATCTIIGTLLVKPLSFNYDVYCKSIDHWFNHTCEFWGIIDFIKFISTHKIRNIKIVK